MEVISILLLSKFILHASLKAAAMEVGVPEISSQKHCVDETAVNELSPEWEIMGPFKEYIFKGDIFKANVVEVHVLEMNVFEVHTIGHSVVQIAVLPEVLVLVITSPFMGEVSESSGSHSCINGG